MKSTYGVINGKPYEIFKDPVTDSGIKKSAKGLLCVNEDFSLTECCTEDQEASGLLKIVFKDGFSFNETSLAEIRNRMTHPQLIKESKGNE